MVSNPALPVILCLHGGGTSAAIFFAQTRNIRFSLRHHFQFIFIDAPNVSGPGPGVVPVFEDSGPFYSWFSLERLTLKERAAEIESLMGKIELSLKAKGTRTTEIAGVMGFSQGTIVSSLLLHKAQAGDARWSNLGFGILMCGACRDDFLSLIDQRLDLPTIHVHGLGDPILGSSRMLVKTFNEAAIIEFDGGHHIPADKRDINRLANKILDISQMSDICVY